MVMIEFMILVYRLIFNCWERLLKYRLLIFVGVPILSSKSVWSLLVWTCKRCTVGFRKVSDQVNFKNMMQLSRLGFAYIVEKVLSTIFTDGTLQLYPVVFLQREEDSQHSLQVLLVLLLCGVGTTIVSLWPLTTAYRRHCSSSHMQQVKGGNTVGFKLCRNEKISIFQCSNSIAWVGLEFWNESDFCKQLWQLRKQYFSHSESNKDLNETRGTVQPTEHTL